MSTSNRESNAPGKPLIGGHETHSAFSWPERIGILLAVVVSVALLAPVHPWTRLHPELRGIMEGIGGCGTIRTAMRTYAKTHNDTYPVLKNAAGNELSILGFGPTDLAGKYFRVTDFVVNSTADAYVITATHRASGQTYIINQDGVESGTFTTGS